MDSNLLLFTKFFLLESPNSIMTSLDEFNAWHEHSSVSPGLERRGWGLSTLKMFLCLSTYIASLYYYPVLREHGSVPPSPIGGNTA